MVFVRFKDSFNCSSILTLGIRIVHWGGSLPRSGLYNIYIEVIKNFSCFFRVFFKYFVFFKSDTIISYDSSINEKGFYCIPELFTTFFAVTFRKRAFLAYLVMLLHLLFSFLQAKKFYQEGHLKYKFLDLDLFIICLLSSFVINAAWLPRILPFFCGAYLSVFFLKILVNSS